MAIQANIVGMTGQAFAISADANKRELSLGDLIALGDSIATPNGVNVDVKFADSHVVHIPAEQQVAITSVLAELNQPNSADSAVSLATLDTVIKAVEGGNDIGDVLAANASGLNVLASAYAFSFSDLAITHSDGLASADVLDLRDLLSLEHHAYGLGDLANYLHFEKSGADTLVHVSTTGQYGAGFSPANDGQTITLAGVDLVTGFASDNAIIQDLLNRQKLITD